MAQRLGLAKPKLFVEVAGVDFEFRFGPSCKRSATDINPFDEWRRKI